MSRKAVRSMLAWTIKVLVGVMTIDAAVVLLLWLASRGAQRTRNSWALPWPAHQNRSGYDTGLIYAMSRELNAHGPTSDLNAIEMAMSHGLDMSEALGAVDVARAVSTSRS